MGFTNSPAVQEVTGSLVTSPSPVVFQTFEPSALAAKPTLNLANMASTDTLLVAVLGVQPASAAATGGTMSGGGGTWTKLAEFGSGVVNGAYAALFEGTGFTVASFTAQAGFASGQLGANGGLCIGADLIGVSSFVQENGAVGAGTPLAFPGMRNLESPVLGLFFGFTQTTGGGEAPIVPTGWTQVFEGGLVGDGDVNFVLYEVNPLNGSTSPGSWSGGSSEPVDLMGMVEVIAL